MIKFISASYEKFYDYSGLIKFIIAVQRLINL
jgi:hypothetical protein